MSLHSGRPDRDDRRRFRTTSCNHFLGILRSLSEEPLLVIVVGDALDEAGQNFFGLVILCLRFHADLAQCFAVRRLKRIRNHSGLYPVQIPCSCKQIPCSFAKIPCSVE